jgi:hypothetical protein
LGKKLPDMLPSLLGVGGGTELVCGTVT